MENVKVVQGPNSREESIKTKLKTVDNRLEDMDRRVSDVAMTASKAFQQLLARIGNVEANLKKVASGMGAFSEVADALTEAIGADAVERILEARRLARAKAQDDSLRQQVVGLLERGELIQEEVSRGMTPATDGGAPDYGSIIATVETSPGGTEPTAGTMRLLALGQVTPPDLAQALVGKTVGTEIAYPFDVPEAEQSKVTIVGIYKTCPPKAPAQEPAADPSTVVSGG